MANPEGRTPWRNLVRAEVPTQQFSREDPFFTKDAIESVLRTFVGGGLDDDAGSFRTSQAVGQAAEGAAAGGVKAAAARLLGSRPLSLALRSAAGPAMGVGSLMAGPLSVALGSLFRPDVSGGTITPGGPEGEMFMREGADSYESVLKIIEDEELKKRLARRAAGEQFTPRELEEMSGWRDR